MAGVKGAERVRELFDDRGPGWESVSQSDRQRVLELMGALLLRVVVDSGKEGGEEDVGGD
jgi:hypothetical protein